MAGPVNNLNRQFFKKLLQLRPILLSSTNSRVISTSQKKKDGHTTTASTEISKDASIPDFSKPLENKNWISFGFDYTSETKDVNDMHNFAFMAISVIFVFGGFFLTYYPDFRERDWTQREAFLTLRHREQLGLPKIDRNYIDPSLIQLPTDEEIGDAEIII